MNSTLRRALVGLALLGLVWVAVSHRAWTAEQRRMAGFLERADAARFLPGLAGRVRRANDPLETRTRALRPVVAQYIDPTWLFDVPESERLEVWNRSLAAVDEIHTLAADLLRRSPTSWEAATIYGAAAYLQARGDDMARSASAMETWEVPLRLAESLIPGYAEPTRYLALAYVNHWQSLSSGQRKAAEITMTEAFRDQRTFDLTVELWLRYMPDRRRALELIPDEPHAWKRLETIFRRRHEWDLYLVAHQRFRTAEHRRIDELLDEAEARVAGGDYRRGTVQFHSALAALEPDGVNLERLERILDRMPAGPVAKGAATSMRRWLEWTLHLGFAGRDPLEPDNLRRLTRSITDLTLPEEALASLLADDLAAAEQAERRWQGGFDEAWDRCFILKAEALLRRREVRAARLALGQVRGSWDTHPTYLRVAVEVARADSDPGLARLETRLAALPATSWSGDRLVRSERSARLDVLPSRTANGLRVELIDISPSGLPIDIVWNGRAARRQVALPGVSFDVEAQVEPVTSVLEIRGLDQRPFSPGSISLVPSDS